MLSLPLRLIRMSFLVLLSVDLSFHLRKLFKMSELSPTCVWTSSTMLASQVTHPFLSPFHLLYLDQVSLSLLQDMVLTAFDTVCSISHFELIGRLPVAVSNITRCSNLKAMRKKACKAGPLPSNNVKQMHRQSTASNWQPFCDLLTSSIWQLWGMKSHSVQIVLYQTWSPENCAVLTLSSHDLYLTWSSWNHLHPPNFLSRESGVMLWLNMHCSDHQDSCIGTRRQYVSIV